MTLTINGEPFAIPDPITLVAFLEQRGLRPQLIVVERNGEIVARDQYGETMLSDGDVLEIVQMMAGG